MTRRAGPTHRLVHIVRKQLSPHRAGGYDCAMRQPEPPLRPPSPARPPTLLAERTVCRRPILGDYVNSPAYTDYPLGDPEQLAKTLIEVQGISQFLSGKYYVKNVKHALSSSGYTMDLDCIKDATGRMARRVERARASAGRPNTAPRRSPDELREVEAVDAETGATRVEYRRSG